MSERYGRCDHCQCDGKLTYMDNVEMWLCYDCVEECEDADEIIIFTDPPTTCDHVWDGPFVEEGNTSTVTCSKCGMWAIDYWMWYGP